VILRFNGREVSTHSALPPLVGATRVNESAQLEVLRGGRIEEVTVVIGELPDEDKLTAAKPQSTTANNIGLVVGDPNAEQRDRLGLEKGAVIVQKVKPGPAERAGIDPGDVILTFDNRPVENVGQFQELLAGIEPGRSVAVLIQRGDGRMFFALRIPKE